MPVQGLLYAGQAKKARILFEIFYQQNIHRIDFSKNIVVGSGSLLNYI